MHFSADPRITIALAGALNIEADRAIGRFAIVLGMLESLDVVAPSVVDGIVGPGAAGILAELGLGMLTEEGFRLRAATPVDRARAQRVAAGKASAAARAERGERPFVRRSKRDEPVPDPVRVSVPSRSAPVRNPVRATLAAPPPNPPDLSDLGSESGSDLSLSSDPSGDLGSGSSGDRDREAPGASRWSPGLTVESPAPGVTVVTGILPPTPPPLVLAGFEPTPPKRAKAARGAPATVLPAAWRPSEAHHELGVSLGLSAAIVAHEAEAMRDWAAAKGERKIDWDAAFRGWLRRRGADPRGGFGTGAPARASPGRGRYEPEENTWPYPTPTEDTRR